MRPFEVVRSFAEVRGSHYAYGPYAVAVGTVARGAEADDVFVAMLSIPIAIGFFAYQAYVMRHEPRGDEGPLWAEARVTAGPPGWRPWPEPSPARARRTCVLAVGVTTSPWRPRRYALVASTGSETIEVRMATPRGERVWRRFFPDATVAAAYLERRGARRLADDAVGGRIAHDVYGVRGGRLPDVAGPGST